MTDTGAQALARLRASRTLTSVPADAGDSAARSGRAIRHAGAQVVLSWQEGLSPAGSDRVTLRTLTPARAALLAVIIGQCWTDPDGALWPGEATTRARVLAAASRLGLDATHAVGSLEVDFVELGIVEGDGDTVRLGPTVAAWTPAEVEALRRIHPRLRAAGR
jgi:hypothetical protein